MIKKLLNVVVLTLAVNFLAIAGLAAYLKSDGRIDKAKLLAIKDILYPPAPTTQPSDATTRPSDESDPSVPVTPLTRLDDLLAKQAGRSAAEQVEFIQQSFDAQMAQLDRREREMRDLQRQVDIAKQQLIRDRTLVNQQQKALETREQEAARLASDKGFQDSLSLYRTMSGKQVKTVFLSLDEALVSQYLQAMEPRGAARIVKEFKSPEEQKFIQRVLDHMRRSSPSVAGAAATQPVPTAASASAKDQP